MVSFELEHMPLMDALAIYECSKKPKEVHEMSHFRLRKRQGFVADDF